MNKAEKEISEGAGDGQMTNSEKEAEMGNSEGRRNGNTQLMSRG